ncbi:MAG: response regulator [bacterium]
MIKVAIAEDHQAIIDGIELQLKNEEDILIVGKAKNGEELVNIVNNKDVDVVVTDIGMPIKNGISATREIKTSHPKVKVLAFSMFDQPKAVEDMLDAGASGYLLKSASLKELVKAIRVISEGRSYYDETIDQNPRNYVKKSSLTRRQKQILELIGEGKSSKEIGERLHIGVETVDTHRKNMMKILNLQGKGELMRYALEDKYRYRENYKNTR